MFDSGIPAPRSRDSSTGRVDCAICRASSPTSRLTICPALQLEKLAAISPSKLPSVAGARLGVPLAGVGKFVAIGLNYADHAAEANLPLPSEPIVFQKAITSLSGPNDPVILPRDSRKSDWEVELGIVIGTQASYVERADALAHVAGYCVVNDVSEREYQMERGGTWDKGKGCDSFGPVGPWLVTTDEIADPQALDLWLDVNGQRMQQGNTRTMIFDCAEIVSYVSRFMTLMPGDIIATGTPPGVGMGKKPDAIYLKPGDVMTLGIEGLGHAAPGSPRMVGGSGEAAVSVFSGRFEGRTAVVTGAASGIGRDVARRLSAEGARVSMWDLNAGALGAAAAEAGASNTQAVDIAAEDAVDVAMQRSIDALGGRLDILVASAGIAGPNGAVKDYAGNDWRKVFDVNVNGVFYCNRAAVRAMDRSGLRAHHQRRFRGRKGGQSERFGLQRLQGGGDRSHQIAREGDRRDRYPRQLHHAGRDSGPLVRSDDASTHRIHAVEDSGRAVRHHGGGDFACLLAGERGVFVQHRGSIRPLRRAGNLLKGSLERCSHREQIA